MVETKYLGVILDPRLNALMSEITLPKLMQTEHMPNWLQNLDETRQYHQ